MGTFLISGFSFQKSNVEKHKNGHNSVILAQNKKIRPLSFLQRLKLKEIKWSYFSFGAKMSEIWPLSWFLVFHFRNQMLRNMKRAITFDRNWQLLFLCLNQINIFHNCLVGGWLELIRNKANSAPIATKLNNHVKGDDHHAYICTLTCRIYRLS